jgi:hypothetical protein
LSTYAPRCRTHHQPAGWKCTVCRSPLCPDCTAVQKTMHVEMLTCGLCREIAVPLTRHRAEEAPFVARLPAALIWPATKDALFSVAGVTLFVFVFSIPGGIGARIAALGLYATSYAIIRMTAANQDEFFVETSGWFDLIWPVFKSGLIYLLLMIAAAVYLVYFKKGTGVLSYVFDPVLIALALAAFVLGPMTTLMAACHAPLSHMLNPALVIGYIAKLGADYFIALAALLVVGIAGGVIGLGSKVINVLPVPFLGTFVGALIDVYFAFVSARILGLLLFVRGDRVGYGPTSDYETPLLGKAVPRGKAPDKAARAVDTSVPEAAVPGLGPATVGMVGAAAGVAHGLEAAPVAEAEAPPAPKSYAPIEFDESSSGPMELLQPGDTSVQRGDLAMQHGGGAAPRAAPRELDAAALPSAAELFSKTVKESAARGDWATAVDAWKACPDKAAMALDAEHLTGIGRTAASQGDNALAREVLELAIVGDPKQLARARAKVFLAKLLKERLGDPARAQVLFQEVVAQAPGSDAAAFAQKMLRP